MDYQRESRGGGILAGAANHPIGKNTFQMTLGMIEKEIERLLPLRDSLSAFADRIAGSRPKDAGAGETMAPSVSIIDELHRKQRRLSVLISECEAERDRIGQALG